MCRSTEISLNASKACKYKQQCLPRHPVIKILDVKNDINILEEILRKKTNGSESAPIRNRKFTKQEYLNLSKKAEIFGKRATVLRTNCSGRLLPYINNLKLIIIHQKRSCTSNGSFCR